MYVSMKIRLYPTKEQEALFYRFAGTARFAYNKALAYKIDMYQNHGLSLNFFDTCAYVQSLKKTEEFAWLQGVPVTVIDQAVRDLDQAYKNFFRRGNKGFPKFKKKGRTTPSFFQRKDAFRQIDSTHIKITGIKEPVRIRPNTIPSDVVNPRVTFDGKFWYISFGFEITEDELVSEGEVIGIDLGIKSLAVLSDGTVYENINKTPAVKKLKKRKKRLQRKVSKKYLMNKDGNKFVKTQNIIKLEQEIRLIDRKLKHIRDTYIHNITADIVKTKPYAVVIEDLNVKGMMKNRHLSKAIQEQEFYKFRQYLTYKCQGYGIRLIVADRLFPSSKTCSNCGHKKDKLSLSERVFKCEHCGFQLDRDLNAAINLKNYGERQLYQQ